MKIEEKLSLDIGSEMQSPFSAAVLQAGLVLAQDAAVVWGPYMRLTAGRWRIRFVGALTEPQGCVIDIVSSHGRVWHAAVPCTPQIGEIELALHAPLGNFLEFRLHCKAGRKLRRRGVTRPRAFRAFP